LGPRLIETETNMTTFADLVPSPAGRFDGIERPYSPEDVLRLRGSVPVTHTLAERGANRLWELLHSEPYINALGAVTGNQAMQMVRAGLKAIYLSGWQVAADANTASAMYPDQSLYPANAAPELCRRINRTLQRADQIEHAEGGAKRDWFAPSSPTPRPVRRTAEQLRDHEGLHRGGRRGRPLRGPAGVREEVRPPGRQGADPDPGA
jgi:Isocitrate lyase